VDTLVKDVLVLYGPLAIGWIAAAFLAWRAFREKKPAGKSMRDQLDELDRRLVAIEVKVDTMWMFTLRRGQSEAIVDKLMKQNSPLVVTEKAYQLIKPMIPDLQALYERYAKGKTEIDEAELALVIEQELGDRILQEICIPNHLYLGACLVIAVEAAKGTWNGKLETYSPCEKH